MPAGRSPFLYHSVALIDTSAAVSIFDKTDSHHEQAKLFFEHENSLVWTSLNITAHESFTRTRYATNLPKALQAFNFLRASAVRVITFQDDDEREALALLRKYDDHKISFHDALCSVLMLRLGIYKVFTFDKDFRILGFQVIP